MNLPSMTPEEHKLLLRRAERLRIAPVASTEDDAILWAAEFLVGDDSYAIPLASLRGVVPLRTVTPIPLSPPDLIGILRFQGQVISALSLASVLGGVPWRHDPTVLLVADAGAGRLVAFDSEEIPRPVRLPLALVEQARTRSTGFVHELVTEKMQVIRLLDLKEVLSRRSEDHRAR